MSSLPWSGFVRLPGDRSTNFENLCRALVRLHYGRHGEFRARRNEPGVEFHLKLLDSCVLGEKGRWLGWQCKFYEQRQDGRLRSAARHDIESSLRVSEVHHPEMTDWLLWTPYALAKQDQDWFYNLESGYRLDLWNDDDLEMRLTGDGLALRASYFGELVVTPEQLARQHRIAVNPIKKRWLEQVHHPLDAEKSVRKILGYADAWQELRMIRERLAGAAGALENVMHSDAVDCEQEIGRLVSACRTAADLLEDADNGIRGRDVDCVSDALMSIKRMDRGGLNRAVRALRKANLQCALVGHNALDDINASKRLVKNAKNVLGQGVVAVLAEAGGGKTQLAAQLTASDGDRPAGVLLHGSRLQHGQTIDEFVKQFKIDGIPAKSIEHFLAAIDAAGVRSGYRLPVVVDGLNESEDPRDWKFILAELMEIIARYPNVVVVCTLRTGERSTVGGAVSGRRIARARESFALMALPDNVRKIEAFGFGGDVVAAVQKYFAYFKIDAADADIPAEFMSNPLNLRIYCELQNPRREKEVRVEYFPLTLSSLLDKYVERVCEGVANTPNVRHRVTKDEVRSFVHKLGWEIWRSGKRAVSERRIRTIGGDAHRDWDSSIVNLLTQEGLLLRNAGAVPGEYAVVPTYDELGGYLVSSALLVNYREDRQFSWFRESPVMALFAGKDSHVLASSIFRSLVALCPARMAGVQLWRVAPPSLRSEALLYTTGVGSAHLDDATVDALRTELREKRAAREFLFRRLAELKSVEGHPLNAQFLDDALRDMSVAERDLSWGEWIRDRAQDVVVEIVAMEAKWKAQCGGRGLMDELRMKWAMWHLVSTNGKVRDLATRAIYWYGRGDVGALFDSTIESLGINDRYVSERMLAASYGVAMSVRSSEMEGGGGKDVLARFGRGIFDGMFAKSARFGTTHVLAREYGRRTVELAASCMEGLLTGEEAICMADAGPGAAVFSWGENYRLDDVDRRGESPFHMDFENYSIGSLVPGRGSYDYSNDEYRKVRAQLLWRVEDIGWTHEEFGAIDREIGKQQWRSGSREGEAGKVDRYGKKYSWMAYFELAGLRRIEGKLGDSSEGRSLLDIDPSFPEASDTIDLVAEDFLGDHGRLKGSWVSDGPVPDMGRYLCVDHLGDEVGPWVVLDGAVSQNDPRRGRSIFCFVRGLFVSSVDLDELAWYLEEGEKGGEWLPVKCRVEGVFGGEIPWCEAFRCDGRDKLGIVVSERKRKVKRRKLVVPAWDENGERDEAPLMVEGKKADATERQHAAAVSVNMEWKVVCEEVIDQSRRYFEVELPVCDYAGCPGGSVANGDVGGGTLAKEISLNMGLVGRPQTLDLFTKEGERATYNTASEREEDWRNHQSMVFLRKDILDEYLRKRGLSMIWGVWGERSLSVERLVGVSGGAVEGETYSVFGHVRGYGN